MMVDPKLPLVGASGDGELCGRITGANALFCLAADIMLAGEKLKIPGVVDEDRGFIGLDGDDGRTVKG